MTTHVELNVDNITLLDEKLEFLLQAEARIFLLYSTQQEAVVIFEKAKKFDLTGSKFMWIVTQSVVGNYKMVRILF